MSNHAMLNVVRELERPSSSDGLAQVLEGRQKVMINALADSTKTSCGSH